MEHFDKYLALVYRYLGIRNRSEKEIRDYLQKKKAGTEVEEKMISLLYEQKLLNDEEFAKSWIRSRARTRPRGKRLLQFELQQKGISDELILKALNEQDEDVPDELTQAKNLIARRVEKLRGEPRQVIYQKVGAFLARRGFGWDIIKKAIDSTLSQSAT